MSEFTCKFCNKSFKREKTLISHTCEQKRRHLNRNDKGVQIGLATYIKFYKFTQHVRTMKTYDDFTKSPYYSAFVKYGNYCINTKVVSIGRYSDYLIKGSKPLDKWCSDRMYSRFLDEFIKVEPVGDALTRTIEYSICWGTEKEMNSHDLFRYGGTNRILQAIEAGRVSPWVLYASQSGQEFVEGLSQEQISLIWDLVDPDKWQLIFNKNHEDFEFAKSTLKLGGY